MTTPYWESPAMLEALREEFGGDHFTDWFECPQCGFADHKDNWEITERLSSQGGTRRDCPDCNVEANIILAPTGCLLVDEGEILSGQVSRHNGRILP
jgi:hypothetical protein